MRNHRYFPVNFFFYDRCGIQDRLEALAQKGWLLEEADYFGWRFVRTEPKTIHYALTYFVNQNQYTSEYDENIAAFNELCAESGWNYVTSRANLRVYRNESASPTPMDTDPVVELATIHRAAKRSFLRSHWIYIIISLLMVAVNIWLFLLSPIKALSDNRSLLSFILFPAAIAISVAELVSYYRWRERATAHAQSTGEFLPARSHPIFIRVMAALIIIAYIAELLLGGLSRDNVETLLRLVMILAAGLAAYFVRESNKEKGVSAGVNRGVTLAVVCLIALFFTLVIPTISSQNDFDNLLAEPEPGGHEIGYNNRSPLPLTLPDLGINMTDNVGDGYFYTRSSVLLSYTEYYPTPLWNGGQKLYYIVLDVNAPFLYDFLYSEFFGHDKSGSDYEQQDPSVWGLDKVWQVYQSYGKTEGYHLCIDNRMIGLIFEPAVDLTDEQKAIIGEKLSPAP